MAVNRGGVITAVGVLAIMGTFGGLAYQAQKGRPNTRPHAHASTDHGLGGHGHVVSLGNDEFHAEVVLTADGKLHLFVLGADEGRVQAVTGEALPALLKGAVDPAAVEVVFAPPRNRATCRGPRPGSSRRCRKR